MKRRLTIVTGIFPPDIGGPASYVPLVAEAFALKGDDVEVICWSDRLDHDDSRWGFKVVRIRRGMWKPLRFLATVARIFRSARASRSIFVNGLPVEATLAGKLAGARTVHKIVGDYAWEKSRNRGWFAGTLDEFQEARKPLAARLFCAMRSWPVRNADTVIVPSRYLAGIVKGWGAPSEKTLVVYNAVEIPEAVSGSALPPFSGRTIMTIGRLVPWKGVDLLLGALMRLPGVRLAVVGDGPLGEDLKRQAESLGVAGRVAWLGHRSRAEAMSLLAQADLFALNSSYEGLPHVVLEAMACGVPVVATRAGGTPEVVIDGETGLLVDFGNVEALIHALRTLLEDRKLARRLADRASEYVRSNFVQDVMLGRTIDTIERTTAREAAGGGARKQRT